MKKTIAAIAGALGATLLLSACGAHDHQYAHTVVPPTCRSIGYTLLVCDCGDRQYIDYTPVSSHHYGDWSSYTEPTLLAFGEEKRACLQCGLLEFRDTAMKEDISSLFITEEGGFLLAVGTERTAYKATVQADSGEEGTKKGYTFSDLLCEGTNVLGHTAFYLDPCTPDRTYARAATAELLWQSSQELRRKSGLLPAWISADSGVHVTVRVFQNDAYLGLYRIRPLATAVGENAATLLSLQESDACLFAKAPAYREDAFALLCYGGETPDAATDSFAAFSAFVRNASIEEFRDGLDGYSDLNALMDYFLLNCFLGLPAGDTAGTLWSTSDGVHWTPSFSTLNNAFGLSDTGYQNTALDRIPLRAVTEDGEPAVSYDGSNLLWQKLCRAFPLELTERYALLRETFLTKENVCGLFSDCFHRIDDGLRKPEKELYALLPDAAWSSRNIESYVETRLKKMDEWLYPKKV